MASRKIEYNYVNLTRRIFFSFAAQKNIIKNFISLCAILVLHKVCIKP